MKNAGTSSDLLKDPFQGLVGYQLRRASLMMASDLGERLTALDLTVTGLSVLLMIEANPGVTQTELAATLGIKRANMAPMVATFADRGLIERHPTDKRSHGLRLTPEGVDLAQAGWGHMRMNEARFAAALSENDREMLNAIVASVRRAVLAQEGGPS